MYFKANCVYTERDLERIFRIPCVIFERAYSGVEGHGLFLQRMDATMKRGISRRMRVIVPLRVLA